MSSYVIYIACVYRHPPQKETGLSLKADTVHVAFQQSTSQIIAGGLSPLKLHWSLPREKPKQASFVSRLVLGLRSTRTTTHKK